MATTFKLSVVAPDRAVADVETTSVVAPGIDGYFGVMAGHQPLIAALKAGLLEYTATDGQHHYVAITGGFAEVSSGKMTVLADEAHLAGEIDLSRAEAELEEARRALRGESSSMTAEQATEALDRAMTRIRAAKKVS